MKAKEESGRKKAQSTERKSLAAENAKLMKEMEGFRKRAIELEDQLEAAQDKYLRLFSEYDNYRKRTSRERADLLKHAAEEVITALLPVVDDLERACHLGGESGKEDDCHDGIRLIVQKLKAILRQKGVEEIPTDGQIFDTDYHEAITHVPAGKEKQKGLIVEEILKGYTLNGKVIRYARVVVAS